MRHALLFLLPALMFAPADDPVVEVSLERTPCYGTCPVDKVVLRSDGAAEYVGTQHVKRAGKFRGKVALDDYREVVRLLDEAMFFELKPEYLRRVTDNATLITIARRETREKRVSDYAGAGPEGLRQVEKKLAGLIDKIEWTRAD